MMQRTDSGVTVVAVRPRPRGETLDRIVSALLLAASEAVVWLGNATPGLGKGVATVLALAITTPVAVRRRLPLAAGVVSIAGVAAIFLAGAHNYSIPLTIAWMCGLYAIAVWTDGVRFVIGLAVLALANVVAAAGPTMTLDNAAYFTVIPGIAMLIARRAVRNRQLLADTLAARAELLEREQHLRAQEAVAEERTRIARELHDLVAHNVSVMVVQAGVERHALHDEHSSTGETLAAIEQAGRQALVEARRLLGVLRRNGEAGDLAPQPSAAEIDVLADQITRAGLPVKLEIDGEPAPLSPGLDLCVYRIVQEGLTNALKHSGAAHAEVVLRYTPTHVAVEISDDGRGPAAGGAPTGHGLVGICERVELYNGQVDIGPGPDGGFQIRARLPLA
jgi:signal transduction histidine kinase